MPNPRLSRLRAALFALALSLSPAALAAPSGLSASATPTAAPAAQASKGTLSTLAGARVIGGRYTPFVVDTTGAETSGNTEVSTRLTLQADLNTRFGDLRLEARLATDIARGTLSGQETLSGDLMPATSFDALLPTDAWVGVRWKDKVVVRAGQMTSNWGMGLLANDGKGWLDERQDDWFVRTETGDRVLRALVLARPFAGSASKLRGLVLSGAVDRVVADDILLRPDDKAPNLFDYNQTEVAVQGIAAARFFVSKLSWFGVYYVYRDQQHDDGKWLKVNTVDLAADLSGQLSFGKLRMRGEAVFINGTTNLSPTPEYPEHEVRQAAIAAQGRLDIGKLRFELDLAWLSGDNNFDDKYLTGFKADTNYQLGIVLFPRLLAAWSGRARGTASNPDVVGVPNEDLERLATRGQVTSTLSLFPKVGVRLPGNLDVYGGLLVAVAPTAPADPFHTKTSGGGEPRNALNKPQGSLLGLEVDLGVRWRLPLPMRSALFVGAEYGVLMPGDALEGLAGNVHGGRLTLAFAPNLRQK